MICFPIEFLQNVVKIFSKEGKVSQLNYKNYSVIPITLSGNFYITGCKYKVYPAPSSGRRKRQTKAAAAARLEEVALRCQELIIMITEHVTSSNLICLFFLLIITISGLCEVHKMSAYIVLPFNQKCGRSAKISRHVFFP